MSTMSDVHAHRQTCWAASLGGCCFEATREHLVSKSLFDDVPVSVEGFPWCKGETKQTGIDSLRSHILCKTHNNKLSCVDQAALNTIEAIRTCAVLSDIRVNFTAQDWLPVRITIPNAISLERWFLKTAINLANNGVGGRKGYLPTKHLVRIAFGLEPIRHPCGLYAVTTVGESLRDFDLIQFAPLWKEARLVGGLFTFRDIRFALWLGDGAFPKQLPIPPQNLREWGPGNLVYHIDRINWEVHKKASHFLKFEWDDPPNKFLSHKL